MSDEYTMTQKAAAEFLGTFSIVFFGAGAVAIDLMTAPEGAGTEFVLEGLGHGALGWTGIGIAFWMSIAIPIYVFGRVSGQHINPAVTVALWLTNRIETRLAGVYILAQLAGGIAGGLVFTLARGQAAVSVGSMGATAPFPEVAASQALLAEFLITFFLMLTIMAMAIDDRAPDHLAGLVIGFVIGAGVITTGNISGASFNPARTIGPYVANTAFGGANLWGFVWIYVVGPLAGAITATYVYEYLVLRTPTKESPTPSATPEQAE